MAITVSIPISTTTSAAFNSGGRKLAYIRTPAALTGVALTFTAAESEAGTYLPVWADGNQVSVVIAVSRHISLTVEEGNALAGATWLKLVSGATELAQRDFSIEYENDPA